MRATEKKFLKEIRGRNSKANFETALTKFPKESVDVLRRAIQIEAITDVVSQNNLKGVTYKGDKKEVSSRGGKFEFRVEARVNYTLLRKNVESVLDELDATDAERDEFRRQMFGE